jgi:selenide,water dikinase
LGDLPVSDDPRVLVDYRTSDDAGVYAFDATRALVQTVDFFTPIVDDPFLYGQIAAANALSDVYAMGARPLTALAVAAFPAGIGADIVKAIFQGGLVKLREAGVALLGGHTVRDSEIKFGYSVTGEVDPARIWSNAGARPGDVLVLTKPIGTGIIATALKFDRAPDAAVQRAVASMTMLNGRASAMLRALDPALVHGCTDITGFSLLGHACEMAGASGCTLEIAVAAVPLLDGVRALAPHNLPGGARSNQEFFSRNVLVADGIDGDLVRVLYDPQTSGGLLLSLDARHADLGISALERAGLLAAHIGVATPQGSAAVVLT